MTDHAVRSPVDGAAQSAHHPRQGDGRRRAHARRVRHTRPAPGRSATVALVAAWSAASLGIASATVSAYWALGGTSLLDTVGGEIERWGRERSGGLVATLWLITVAKLVIAIAPLMMSGIGERHLPRWTTARWTRLLCWLIALGLTFYGGLLSAAGLLVEAGLLDSVAADDADRRALKWHAYLWDPWFTLWGAAFTVTMWRTRTTRAPGAGVIDDGPDA